jgi:hypothetical protein
LASSSIEGSLWKTKTKNIQIDLIEFDMFKVGNVGENAIMVTHTTTSVTSA